MTSKRQWHNFVAGVFRSATLCPSPEPAVKRFSTIPQVTVWSSISHRFDLLLKSSRMGDAVLVLGLIVVLQFECYRRRLPVAGHRV